jgi:hypothetical protein
MTKTRSVPRRKQPKTTPSQREDTKLDVFITWSQKRSRALAEELQKFVRLVTFAKPWISPDIPKGAHWPTELADRLRYARAGIVCLTPENVNDPWVLFEAGALTQTPLERVWTVLLDLAPSDVPPPLGLRQHTEIKDKEDFLKMIDGINATTDSPHEQADLQQLFDKLWPDLDAAVNKIRTTTVTAVMPAPRPDEEVLAEILEQVRETGRVTTWRTDKMLHMLHRIYEAILQEKAPALSDMRKGGGDYAEQFRKFLDETFSTTKMWDERGRKSQED